MHPGLKRIISFGISIFYSVILFGLNQSNQSSALAEEVARTDSKPTGTASNSTSSTPTSSTPTSSTPTSSTPTSSTPTSSTPTSSTVPENLKNLFEDHPEWLKFRIRPTGTLTTTIKLPQDSIDPLCSLHLEFSTLPDFVTSLGEFSLGAANFSRGTFAARMAALPEVRPGKRMRRIFTRGVLLCPAQQSVNSQNFTGVTATSRSQAMVISRGRIAKRTSLNSFVKSFLLGKLRRSAYGARPRFKVSAVPAPDQKETAPLITRYTDKINVPPSQAYDIVAYAITTGTPPFAYSWQLIDQNGGIELDLAAQRGFRIINDSTGSMLIAFGDSTDLIGKSLRVTVKNNFGEVTSNLIPVSYAIPPTTAAASPSPTKSGNPTNTSTASPTFTPTPSPTPTSTPLQFGYNSRPVNNTCVAPVRNSGSTLFDVARVFPSLTFNQPVKIAQAPDDSGTFYVAEQRGVIRSFLNNATVSTTSNFLDLTSRVNYQLETGLMGFAFHPNWPATPLVFVSYVGGNLESRLSSFATTDGGRSLNITTEQRILTVAQPNPGHTIGDIQFGADGLLYVSLGDGRIPMADAGQNSQSTSTLLGKIVRIDIDGSTESANYSIPASNPYPGGALCGITNGSSSTRSCAEIFASGFRNPWRFSIDPATNEVWVADVGQSSIEEANKVTAGGNYGWNCMEGSLSAVTNCYRPPNSTLIPPAVQYTHADGGYAITGGPVYRGNAIPALYGRYLFGDYVSGNIWSVPRSSTPTITVTSADALNVTLNIVSFGTDRSGEVYFLNYSGGTVHKIVPPSNQSSEGVASRLSATGCVNPGNPTQPASGLIPFDPISPLWSDGSKKGRWLALPNNGKITIGANGDFQFPRGTVLMKDFRLNNKLIETRLLMLHPDGVWAGYSYRWNDQQTEATLLSNGLDATVQGRLWTFPSPSQCMACHTQAAGRSLGAELLQLNSDLFYTQTNRLANQLRTMDHIKLFSPDLSTDPASLPALSRPQENQGTLSQRARSYLHANCSHCHRPGGGTPVNMDLRFTTSLPDTNTCNRTPLAGSLGIANARILAPGAPAQSVLPARMNRRDTFQMPPLGTHVIDNDAVGLISAWIQSLPDCNKDPGEQVN